MSQTSGVKSGNRSVQECDRNNSLQINEVLYCSQVISGQAKNNISGYDCMHACMHACLRP